MRKFYLFLILLMATVAVNSSCSEPDYYDVTQAKMLFRINPSEFPTPYVFEFVLNETAKTATICTYLNNDFQNRVIERGVKYTKNGNSIIFDYDGTSIIFEVNTFNNTEGTASLYYYNKSTKQKYAVTNNKYFTTRIDNFR